MFRRKVTKMIERLETTNEGRNNPQITDILKRMDNEIADLKKEVNNLKK